MSAARPLTHEERISIEHLRCDQCDNIAGHRVDKPDCPACADVKELIRTWRAEAPDKASRATNATLIEALQRIEASYGPEFEGYAKAVARAALASAASAPSGAPIDISVPPTMVGNPSRGTP